MQETLKEIGVTDIDFPATACDVNFDVVAGLVPNGPSKLLFWKGKLIRMVVEFDPMNYENFSALALALLESYGKPYRNSRGQFLNSTWRMGDQTLELERTENFPTKIGIYLTQQSGWKEYQSVRVKADAAVDRIKKQARSNSLKH